MWSYLISFNKFIAANESIKKVFYLYAPFNEYTDYSKKKRIINGRHNYSEYFLEDCLEKDFFITDE